MARVEQSSIWKKRTRIMRPFLALAIVLGLASVADTTGRHMVSDARMSELMAKAQEDHTLFQGYMEGEYPPDVDFFTYSGGHLPWVEDMMADPELKDIARSSMDTLITEPDTHKGYGSVMETFMRTTHDLLRSEYPKVPEDFDAALDSEYQDEIVRYTILSMAGSLNSHNPHFDTMFDYSSEQFNDFPWKEDGWIVQIFRNNGIMLAPDGYDNYENYGIDRSVHATHHMFLTYFLGKSYEESQAFHLQTPSPLVWNGLARAVAAYHGVSIEQGFSIIAGYGHEVKETYTNLGESHPSDGLYDQAVDWDFTANQLGREMGEFFLRRPSSREIHALFEHLNSDELRGIMQHPYIPSDLEALLRN